MDAEGNDTGELSLSTGSLNTTDLTNRSYSSNQSFGVNASVSVNGEDTSPEGVNRDVAQVNKEIYDVDRQQGNIDLTVDHRLLSEDGRKEIRQQLKALPDNLEQVANDLVDAIEKGLDPGAGLRAASNAEIMKMVREHLAELPEDERQEIMQFVGVFIDGTGNNKYNDIASGEETNVAILSELYDVEASPLYYEGVGSSWYSALTCGLTGCGGQARASEALEDIGGQWLGGDTILMIDVIGFSRGSTQGVQLTNKILQDGIPGVPQENIVINGAYLFDTVSSTGIPGNDVDIGYDLSVRSVVPTFHAVAGNEYRGLFGLQSQNYSDGSFPGNVVEQEFFGAHSDIGGGYAPREQEKENSLSSIPLQWMHENAVNNGSPFSPIPTQYQVPASLQKLYDAAASGDDSAYQKLEEDYIHDSRYFWERWQNDKTRPVYYPRGVVVKKNWPPVYS